jgi:hypothetical protein
MIGRDAGGVSVILGSSHVDALQDLIADGHGWSCDVVFDPRGHHREVIPAMSLDDIMEGIQTGTPRRIKNLTALKHVADGIATMPDTGAHCRIMLSDPTEGHVNHAMTWFRNMAHGAQEGAPRSVTVQDMPACIIASPDATPLVKISESLDALILTDPIHDEDPQADILQCFLDTGIDAEYLDIAGWHGSWKGRPWIFRKPS